MKSRILIAAALAVLVVPAASFAGTPTGQDRENGARACRALRASMGWISSGQTYGTAQSNRRNAWAAASRSGHARRIRTARRSLGVHRRAGRSRTSPPPTKARPSTRSTEPDRSTERVRQAASPRRRRPLRKRLSRATVNAAKTCKAERAGRARVPREVRQERERQKRFGKCVSLLAKAPSA